MARKHKVDNIDLPKPSPLAHELSMLRYYAERVNYWAGTLSRRPIWETLAEEEIKIAIKELKRIEAMLNEALELYHTKSTGE